MKRTKFIIKNLHFIVLIILLLLASDLVFIFNTIKKLEKNKILQQQTIESRQAISNCVYLFHNADLGLRGYALFGESCYLSPLNLSYQNKDSVFKAIEIPLIEHGYKMTTFYSLKDSINAYFTLTFKMKDLFGKGDKKAFQELAQLDKGQSLWLQYKSFSQDALLYEKRVYDLASLEYKDALKNTFYLHLVLSIVCIPVLLFTVYHTNKKFKIEQHLKELEEKQKQLLSSQNAVLEQMVKERTEEIELQKQDLERKNEEILQRKKELLKKNQDLEEAKEEQLALHSKIILEKSESIKVILKELESLKNNTTPPALLTSHIHKVLHSSILTEESWENFREAFEKVYPGFFLILKNHYPQFSACDQRLLALIKLNMTVKEMSQMLGVSDDTVRKYKYRIKKKVQLYQKNTSVKDFVGNLMIHAN